MLGRDTPPTPLWDGEILEAAFFLVMRGLWRGCFPVPERGVKGCVTVRGAAWVEGIAGYSFEKLGVARWYLSASVTAFDLSGSAWTSHTPGPSREGRLGRRFLEEYDWIFRFVSREEVFG